MRKVLVVFPAMLLTASGVSGQQAASESAEGNKVVQESRADKSYADWSRFDPANFQPEHTFRFQIGDIRVVYKLWAGPQDVLDEYDRWHEELSAIE